MTTIPFRAGDEILQPFLLVAEGAIVNLSAGTVYGEVRSRLAKVADLWAGANAPSGIVIEQLAPPPAGSGYEQLAHGLVVLDEALTRLLSEGATSRINLFFVTSAGVTISARPIILQRLP